ncbi:MAG: PAS domain S-box protein [Actinobacteria bacterium]|nr:PAS domain S-box protein [Actinomycetota bacterium]
MTAGVPIPLHVAVHVLGLTVAAGLAVYGVVRRDDAGPGWISLVFGALLLAGSHVIAGALVAPELAWPLYLRAAGYAALAVGSAGRLLGSSTTAVVVAAAPPGAYLTAAIAGAAAAVASFRGVLGRTGGTFVLAVGIGLWASADLAMRGPTTLAAVLSLVGSATVGSWLLWRARASLLTRTAASFLVLILLLVVGLAAVGGAVFGADLQEDALDQLAAAAQGRAEEIGQGWTDETLTIAQLFATDQVAARVEEDDPGRLQNIARLVASLPDVDVALLVGEGRQVLASYDWGVRDVGVLPTDVATAVAGDELVAEALRGTGASGIVAVGSTELLAMGATPIVPEVDGQPRQDLARSVLVVGLRATDPRYLEDVSTTAGAAVTVVVGGAPAASTLEADAAQDVAGAIAAGERRGTVEIGGTSSFLAASPLEAQGTPVAWVVLSEAAGSIADAERDFARTLFAVAMVGLTIAALLAAATAARTTRPVRRLTRAAERIAAGERDVRTGIDRDDEVGRLARSFDEMTGALTDRERELQQAAATEAALRGRLEVLTASMGEGLLATDTDGRVQTVNPAAEELLGVTSDRVEGQPIEDVLIGVDAAGVSILEALGHQDAGDVRSVRSAIDRQGRLVPVAATAAPMRAEDGTHLGRVYVLRDITGEVEVERMKTEFLANISHELRTPLTPIRGYAEVMRRRTIPPEKISEFGQNIVESTNRLERIVSMLVDFAALEAGRLRVRREPTALSPVVDEVLYAWRERFPDRRFSRYLERDLPDVLVDPRLLGRVLEEVIDNAVKFSDEPVRLLASSDDRTDRVRLTVRDEGMGIPEDELEMITRDFHQADGSATRKYGGLGLGLSLVYRIAERFGAEVEIASTQGEGTEVHLLLPVADDRYDEEVS